MASGRPTYGITPIANELMLTNHGGFILAFNGGKIIDYTSRETVFEQTIGKPEVEALYNAADKAGLAILTYQDYGIVTTQRITTTLNTKPLSISYPLHNATILLKICNILSTNVLSLATQLHCMS